MNVENYLAMWHERNPSRRRELVESLFAEDAVNFTSASVARGIEELVARVERSHVAWVAEKDFVFRPVEGFAARLGDAMKLTWEMVPRTGGAPEVRGVDVLVLNSDERIRVLYQFGEPLTALR